MMVYPRSRHGIADPRLNMHFRQAMFDFVMRTVGESAELGTQRVAVNRVLSLLAALQSSTGIIAAELRPPRAELDSYEGMDAWIDMYHAVRTLTRQDNAVFLTDSAVGTQEENNLRHLVNNLGRDVPHERVVPFLTSKHSLEFCLSYAEQAWQHGFASLVVLGGDRTRGPRALCRTCLGTAPRNPGARAAPGAGRLGQSVR